MFSRTLYNISERELLSQSFLLLRPPVRISTFNWSITRRMISSKETSFGVGNFDPNRTPYMEYVLECLDNPFIPVITSMKSARIAWTENINNYRGNRIENNPTQMLLGFPTGTACKNFAKRKFPNFIAGVPALRGIINKGVAKNKENMYEYSFPNGSLSLVTLGSIANQKSDNLPYIEVEEPDDAKDEVSGQGDTFANLSERQKTVPTTMRKFIFGGTPTDKDFSRVEEGIKNSNWLVFKAECHECNGLVPMDHTGFTCIHVGDYADRYIDPIYGDKDPLSATFLCPHCGAEWSFEQKNLNIIEGKKHGFTDHTGNFSKGWHPKFPERTDVFGLHFSELLSPFPGSDFVTLMKKKIVADIEKAKGDEGKLKSFTNNSMGIPYASGISAMEVEEMVALRKNYPENICPLEAFIPFTGIDVQHNRFAITTIAWGRNGNIYLITWKEIYGNVLNKDDEVWQRLTEYCLAPIPHAGGKQVYIEAVSIDSGDGGTTELVYEWVKQMNEATRFNGQVRATKGVKELKFSVDEIYSPPKDDLFSMLAPSAAQQYKIQQTLAQRMGVKVYSLGAHKAHDEILRRIGLNLLTDCASDVFYFNEQTYGGFEEQVLSCRKLVDTSRGFTRSYYQLISGKRKEAIDALKNAYHASIAAGIKTLPAARFKEIETYLLGK